MPGILPLVLTVADFAPAELGALRLDGEAFAVGDGMAPLDSIPGPELRAAALGPLVPSGAIVDRDSAAWIWGARDEPPPRIELCVDARRRASLGRRYRSRVREVALSPGDVSVLGDVLVTAPLRTLLDLIRADGGWRASDARTAARLCRRCGLSPEAVGDLVEARPRLPNKRLAQARLRELGQPA